MDRHGALICGFYGYSNMGDEAMLAGMIRLLRQAQPNFPLTVLTFSPEETQRRHGIATVPTHPPQSRLDALKRQLRNPEQQAMKANPLFVLGGGDLLRDGVDRPVAEFWLAPMQRALKLKRKTALLGVSVGEIWKPYTQTLIPEVLNQVDLIAVRDRASQKKLQDLGVSQTIHVMPDLALAAVQALSSASASESSQTSSEVYASASEKPLQIGFSVRWMSNRGQMVDYSYAELQQEMAAIADYNAQQYGAIVHFLPFQAFDYNYYSNDDDDYIAILEILRHSNCSRDFVVHRYFPSLEALTPVLRSLDLMVGMRLHSLILAAGLGVPVIAAQYDPKVEGFMTEIQSSDFSIPLGEFKRDRVIPLIDQILSQPEKAQGAIAQGLSNYQTQWSAIADPLADLIQAAKSS